MSSGFCEGQLLVFGCVWFDACCCGVFWVVLKELTFASTDVKDSEYGWP